LPRAGRRSGPRSRPEPAGAARRRASPRSGSVSRVLEVLFAVVVLAALAARSPVALAAAQLDTSDLARDGLGQIGELEPADTLVGGQLLLAEREDLAREGRARGEAGGQRHERLGDGEAERVGARHYGDLGDGGVLDERALQLEGADAVA